MHARKVILGLFGLRLALLLLVQVVLALLGQLLVLGFDLGFAVVRFTPAAGSAEMLC